MQINGGTIEEKGFSCHIHHYPVLIKVKLFLKKIQVTLATAQIILY